MSASAPLRCPCFPPRSCTSGVCWPSEPKRSLCSVFLIAGTGWESASPEAPSRLSRRPGHHRPTARLSLQSSSSSASYEAHLRNRPRLPPPRGLAVGLRETQDSEVLEMSSEVAGPGPTHGRSNLSGLAWDLLLVPSRPMPDACYPLVCLLCVGGRIPRGAVLAAFAPCKALTALQPSVTPSPASTRRLGSQFRPASCRRER